MPKTTTYSSSIGTRLSFGCISDKRRTVLRITLAAFAVLLLFSLAAAPASAAIAPEHVEFSTAVTYNEGTFILGNIPADLIAISTAVNSGKNITLSGGSNSTKASEAHYKLSTDITDIDLSSVCGVGKGDWTPIGTSSNPFKGTFDGNGKTISNLYIDSDSYYQGLFGYTDGATIKNLGLINVNVKDTSCDHVGGLVGQNTGGNITYCYATGTVIGKDNVGGLVGWNSGNITYCYATGTVIGNSETGGLVGQNTGGTITNSYATGSVDCTGTVSNVGGLVGWNHNGGKIENCYATGAVIQGGSVGGLVGRNVGSATIITNSVALNWYVSGNTNVGRVVGLNQYVTSGKIENCYAWKGMNVNGELAKDNIGIDQINGADATSAQVWANPEFYKTTLGWDISAGDTTVWKINQDDGTKYPLPYLKETLATRAQVEYLKPKTPITPTTIPTTTPSTTPTTTPSTTPTTTPSTTPTTTPSTTPTQSSGGSTDTGSGHFTDYPRTVTDGGHVSFGTSPIVTGVDMPEGVTGNVELITVVVTDTDGREFYATFEINAPKSADGEKSLIYFQLDLKKIEADGYTVKDVVLSHNNEDGTWTDLKTTYLGTKDGKAKYSAENTVGYSVFAIYYTEGASIEDTEPEVTATVIQTAKPEPTSVEPAYVEPTMPSTVPTPEQTKSPVGLVGLGLGLLGAFAALRRK